MLYESRELVNYFVLSTNMMASMARRRPGPLPQLFRPGLPSRTNVLWSLLPLNYSGAWFLVPSSACSSSSYSSSSAAAAAATAAAPGGSKADGESASRHRITWYPGHMVKAQRAMADAVQRADLVIEVRDARIPHTSANPHLADLEAGHTPRLVVLNKADLADPHRKARVAAMVAAEAGGTLADSGGDYQQDVIFTDATVGSKAGGQILRRALALAGKPRFATVGSLIMVLGVPNVGKSTIINAIRQQGVQRSGRGGGRAGRKKKKKSGKVAPTGAKPGVTRGLRTFAVSEDPLVHLIDTPGVMMPRIEDEETGLKLALTGAIPDGIVPPTMLAEYLLYALNRQRALRYVDEFELSGPSDSIEEVLLEVARSARTAAVSAKGVADVETDLGGRARQDAARAMIAAYRAGKLGRLTLDVDDEEENDDDHDNDSTTDKEDKGEVDNSSTDSAPFSPESNGRTPVWISGPSTTTKGGR